MEKWTSDISNVCLSMRERADIEGSKGNVVMDAWVSRGTAFPAVTFSGTSS